MSYTESDFPRTHMYDSDLRELLHKYLKLAKDVGELDKWKETFEEQFGEFEEFIQDLEDGKLPDEIIQAIIDFLKTNALDLMGSLIGLVVFNITDDGYFVAYIPESWNAITFNTTGLDIVDELQPEYGHLVLSYEASTNAY